MGATSQPKLPELHEIPGAGVTAAAGFAAGGIHAGFRKNPERLDMALLVAQGGPCAAAGTFTQNRFCAAPVQVSRAHLGQGACYGLARAVVVNSGNANAATGAQGLAVAEQTAQLVADAVECAADQVLVASTGVIGQQLDLAPFEAGVPALAAQLAAGGEKGDAPLEAEAVAADAAPAEGAAGSPAGAGADGAGQLADAPAWTPEQAAAGVATGAAAARAIMTTDTVPKERAVSYVSADPAYAGATFHVGGMCKGSGMIMPNMATMIAVLTTDAPVEPRTLHQVLLACVKRSFNKVTVDSDTSTNDTCFALASGAAAADAAPIVAGTLAAAELEAAFQHVCTQLARAIAADGEGASKLVTVNVSGAATDADADLAARTVANSPLVKTAIYGHDCNWGRIADALGRSGAAFNQEDVTIRIMDLLVCEKGLTVPFDEDEALRRFERPEIVIDADLGAGDCATTIWTCDLTHEYVTINGDYRT